MLIIFANTLDPDQALQNVGPDLDLSHFLVVEYIIINHRTIYRNRPPTLTLCLLIMLIIFANTLDPDQARRNVGSDLDPNCLTL